MTESQKRLRELAERQSSERQRMAELSMMDSLDDEQRSELDRIENGTPDLERTMRAAQVAVDAEDEAQRLEGRTRTADTPEDRELRELAGRANVGTIFDAALEHRATSGAEKEIQDHHRLHSNQVPLMLLETRAVTPAPANVGQDLGEIIPGVFPQACATWLGVDMPVVPVGQSVYPVLSTNATVHNPAENADAAETTGAFTADVLTGSRLQAAFFYSREDRARFAGMDSALRMNLSDALSDALDLRVIAGTDGLLTGTNLANHNVTVATTFASYKASLGYGRVDGTWASMVGDIRVLMGSETFAHAATAYRSNNADDDALMVLMGATGGVKVSSHVPAAASNRQNTVVRLGMQRDMVSPVWEGLTLIPDEVTLAASGQIKITAVMLSATKILRPAGFYKQQVQIA